MEKEEIEEASENEVKLKKKIKTKNIIIGILAFFLVCELSGTDTTSKNTVNDNTIVSTVTKYQTESVEVSNLVYEDISKQYSKMKDEVESLKLELNNTIEAKQEAENISNSLSKEITLLEEKNDALEKEKKEIEEKNKTLEQEKKSLESQVSASKTTTQATSSISSSYSTTKSTGAKSSTSAETTTNPTSATYVLNTSTKKFHYPSCSSVSKMADKNKSVVTESRDSIVARGYVPCKNCNP